MVVSRRPYCLARNRLTSLALLGAGASFTLSKVNEKNSG